MSNNHIILLINDHYHINTRDNTLINGIAVFRSSNPRNTIVNISACACNLIKYIRRAVEFGI